MHYHESFFSLTLHNGKTVCFRLQWGHPQESDVTYYTAVCFASGGLTVICTRLSASHHFIPTERCILFQFVYQTIIGKTPPYLQTLLDLSRNCWSFCSSNFIPKLIPKVCQLILTTGISWREEKKKRSNSLPFDLVNKVYSNYTK